jgi:hypothetical protein
MTYREKVLAVMPAGKRMGAGEITSAISKRYKTDMSKMTGMISTLLGNMVDKGEVFVDGRTTGPRGGKMYYSKAGTTVKKSNTTASKKKATKATKPKKVSKKSSQKEPSYSIGVEILKEVRELKELILDAFFEKPVEETTNDQDIKITNLEVVDNGDGTGKVSADVDHPELNVEPEHQFDLVDDTGDNATNSTEEEGV